MSITPDRWRRIETVLSSAASSRQSAGRRGSQQRAERTRILRHEVESLLTQHTSTAAMLERGAEAAASALIRNAGAWLAPEGGSAVHEILAPVGAGGMGEVYRARDTQLGRDVAIKVLPRAFTADPDRLARFEREARCWRRSIIRTSRDSRPRGSGRQSTRWCWSSSTGETLAERIARRGPLPRRRRARDRAADRRRARRGAREGDRPPRSEAGQHQDHARRHGEGARLRAGEACIAEGSADAIAVPDRDRRRHHARGTDPRHGGLHEPGAGARSGRRQADRYLGVRLRALRDVDRRAAFARQTCPTPLPPSWNASRTGAHCRPRLRHRSPPAATLPGEGPEAAAPRHRRRANGTGARTTVVAGADETRRAFSAAIRAVVPADCRRRWQRRVRCVDACARRCRTSLPRESSAQSRSRTRLPRNSAPRSRQMENGSRIYSDIRGVTDLWVKFLDSGEARI